MAYFTPYIDSTGIHIPTYTDIRDELIEKMKQIFGSDIYIDKDSQDYQQISIFAKKIFDSYAHSVAVYNDRTVNTAVGVGLDNMCAMAGITRKPATYSTVQLTITGSAGTNIASGQASDKEGRNKWDLPENVVIPENGQIAVECKSHEKGYIQALPNTITKIVTPTYGWDSVTNNYNSSPGINEETDAALRARYAESTQLPSRTVFEGTIAALKTVFGVTKVRGYENDTGQNNSLGHPPHSVTFVVEGGEEELVALEILNKKTPGCYTNGTTEVSLTSITGNITIIRYYKPTYKNIYIKVKLKKLAGYNDNYAEKIKQAILKYVNELQIAETIYRSVLWSVATSQMSSLLAPEFSVIDIQLSTDGSSYKPEDITQQFYEAALTDISRILVEVS